MRGTTEVTLDRGYVADAVAICSLQYRFWQQYRNNLSRVPTVRDYKQHQANCIKKEMANYMAFIFEAKVSRADFLSTFNDSQKQKNRHKPIGNLHWCIAPKGIVHPNELPDFWGLLEPYGVGLTEKIRPLRIRINGSKLDRIAHSLLWPIQARRNYIYCQKCGKSIYEGYCGRCFISPRGFGAEQSD